MIDAVFAGSGLEQIEVSLMSSMVCVIEGGCDLWCVHDSYTPPGQVSSANGPFCTKWRHPG